MAQPGRALRLAMIGGGPTSWIGRMHHTAAELDGLWRVVGGVFSGDPARSRAAGASSCFGRRSDRPSPSTSSASRPGQRRRSTYPEGVTVKATGGALLLVEDDDGDALMTREAFEYYKIRNKLHVVTDGEQALQLLRRTGPFAGVPRPGLILLDVNLPRLSGLEVLAELKHDPELAILPVVMLTTSQAEEDILRSYKLHANAYVTKPVDFENFIAAIRQIDDFFLTLVKLPGPAGR